MKRRAEDDHVDSPKRKKAKTESGAAPLVPAAKLGKHGGNATSPKEKVISDKKSTTAPDRKVKEKKAKDTEKAKDIEKAKEAEKEEKEKMVPAKDIHKVGNVQTH